MAKGISDLSAEDILYSRDIDARVDEIRARISVLMAGSQDDEAMDEVQDLSSELARLRQFRESVTLPGAWARPQGMSFIRESYWETYMRSVAYDIYGAATELPYWDREAFAADEQEEYSEVALDGAVFLYNGK